MFLTTVDYSNWISNLKVGDEVLVSVTPLSEYSKRIYKKAFNKLTVKRITSKTKVVILSDDSRFDSTGLIIKPKTGWAVNPHFHKDPNTRIFPLTEEDVLHMEKSKKVKELINLFNKNQDTLIEASNEDLDNLINLFKNLS